LNRELPEFKPEALLRYIQYHALDISQLIDHQPNINARVIKLCKGRQLMPFLNVETHARACLLTPAVNRKKHERPSHRTGTYYAKSWYSSRD
jgi:hypothetical protein